MLTQKRLSSFLLCRCFLFHHHSSNIVAAAISTSTFCLKDKSDRSEKTRTAPKSNKQQTPASLKTTKSQSAQSSTTISGSSEENAEVDPPLPSADPKDLKASLNRLVESYKRELSKLRGATASPGMLDSVIVEAYGEHQPLTSLAQVSLKSPSLLVVNPFDSSLSQQIADAIRAVEELNLNPSVDGQIVNVPVPRTSKETREATAKLVSKAAEGAKVRVRRLRQAALERIKKKNEGSSEDDIRRDNKEVDDQVSAVVAEITKLADKKRIEVESI
jgi:ribosome recycling factor